MQNPNRSLRRFRWMLFLLGWFKIPLIAFVRPRLIFLDDHKAEITIRLRRRTRNHLGSMYFGALAVGADVAAGIHAFYFAEKMGKKVSFAFKGITADFVRRAESNVLFRSVDGELVRSAMEKSAETGERINQEVKVEALNQDNEPVALFTLVVSVKVT